MTKAVIKNIISETALLNRYLKSRGINPEFVSKDQKVAHSKTNQFKVWMNSHINDPVKEEVEKTPVQKRLAALKQSVHKHQEIRVTDGKKLHSEAVDKKDTITFDIPLLIRVLEFAREELKSDVNLHKMVERLISIRGKGTLTMNQYGRIVKEEFNQLDEVSQEKLVEAYNSYHNNRTGFAKRPREDDEYHTPDPTTTTHKIGFHVSKDGGEKHHRTVTISNTTKSHGEATSTARAHLEKQGYTIHEGVESLDETWKYHTYPDNETARKAVKAHHEWRGEDGMASGNPARTMGNNKVAYKGEFKGPKPAKRVSEGVVDAVKKAWKAVSDFDSMQPKYDGNTRRRQALKKKLATDKKKVAEAKEANYGGDYQASVLAVKAKAEKKPVDIKALADRMQASYRRDNEKNKQGTPVKENTLEPMAATQAPNDCANNPDDTVPSKRSAKLKLLLGGKKGQIKEDMYDSEKEDKSVATPGKKPKLNNPGVNPETKEAPQAAAILSGGKTLTGEPRDTIEIDPKMKMKQSSPNSQKTV
jgi:hypothetical protein